MGDSVRALSCEDILEATRLIQDIPSLATSLSDTVKNLLKRIKNNELNTIKGLSFLELKNHMLLSYLLNLSHVIFQKFHGRSIENNASVERLSELRIVIEKMKPIDEKLKYQVNKLLTSEASGNIDTADPLRFQANPESLANDDDESQLKEKSSVNVYAPPKISAAYYEEDHTLEGKKRKIAEHSQKRALSTSVLYELRKEYDTGPDEIKETINPYKMKLNNEMKERARYEEDYMLRLPMTKKQKHESRQMMTVTNFNANFDEFSAVEQSERSTSRRKSSGKKGKFSKFKGKKRGKKN